MPRRVEKLKGWKITAYKDVALLTTKREASDGDLTLKVAQMPILAYSCTGVPKIV